MGFKMKGPSTHKGTKRHTMELKLNRNMDQTNLSDGRSGSSAFQLKDSSPAKGIFGNLTLSGKQAAVNPLDTSIKPKVKKKVEKTKAELKTEKKTKNAKAKTNKKSATAKHKAEMKKMKKFAKDENKKLNEKRKEQKKVDLQTKRTKKQAKAAMKYDKPGTVVSRTAKKVGKKIKQGVKQKVADVKQGISDRKILKAKARKANDTPEKRLAAKKEKRTNFADQLEYIFLDGKRPDDRRAKRQAKQMIEKLKNQKLDKKEKLQNKTIPAPYDISKLWKKDEKTRNSEYANRGKQYKNYKKDSYSKETERQQAIFDKTGKWDYKNAPKK